MLRCNYSLVPSHVWTLKLSSERLLNRFISVHLSLLDRLSMSRTDCAILRTVLSSDNACSITLPLIFCFWVPLTFPACTRNPPAPLMLWQLLHSAAQTWISVRKTPCSIRYGICGASFFYHVSSLISCAWPYATTESNIYLALIAISQFRIS